MPKTKTGETGSLSKYELAKLKKLYSQGKASYGSIKSLQKASGYSDKKVKSFLLWLTRTVTILRKLEKTQKIYWALIL